MEKIFQMYIWLVLCSGGYAPFLSLASRGLEVISQNDEDDLPGPGTYEIHKIQVEPYQ